MGGRSQRLEVMSSRVSALLAGLLLATIVYFLYNTGRRDRRLPPGPPTLPVLGNIHQIPKQGVHFQFTEWARQYGGIYTLKLGTGTAAVITDPRLVKQLLDRKSSKYAERPRSYVANLIAGGDHILLMDYGNQWRETRKLFHSHFMEKMVESEHIKVQEAEARQMLRDYLIEPEQHMLHPKRYSNSITMSLVWGVRTPTAHTRHMHRLYDVMEVWSKVMETGATPPVDIYPFLHWLPQRVFTNWIDRATHVRNEMNNLYADFLYDIRLRRKQVGNRGSFMDKVLDSAENEKRPEGLTFSDHELYFMGGTATEGGSDTSASIITAFVHAMVAYPEIQRKAQLQIDSVVGPDRSPTWQDFPRLPYIAQCVKETMRWRPVTPLAFPHALAEDDWISAATAADETQYLLPKGTTIILNAWGIHHDPSRFPNPETFDPDHYASTAARTLATDLANGPWEKRDHYGYGAGRRFCPGAHLAERNLFLAMAKLLWGFHILAPAQDKKEGRPANLDLDPQTGYSAGFLVCAKDFAAEFEVRGREREATIRREYDEAEREVFGRFGACGEERA
ncbi:putative cytochrome P450 [Hortaea werneckii]|nr:putative cytochrome P450 [Hortaea werneckii]KAI6794194.1 putative cytochrome P450 [Hortaea werneckii]KAI6896081.1 putative cytochrome P450 [Hortaea werneckii]KAI6919376.1 putative cytochrome P450 [Hortaea werneckii]KAI6953037.1 putative cytochrome P450 [Hortaea werneckii]